MSSMVQNNSALKIRAATPKDAAALLEIYSYYVRETAITFEYEVPSKKEFTKRIKNTLKKYPYLVAEVNGKIAGYAYAGVFKGRKAYDWSVETTVYVQKDIHKKGIGSRLYKKLEEILFQMNITNVNACIAFTEKEDEYLTNASPAFHKAVGYTLVGKFSKCAYKFNRWYDMIWMEKIIGSHNENQKEIICFKDLNLKALGLDL